MDPDVREFAQVMAVIVGTLAALTVLTVCAVAAVRWLRRMPSTTAGVSTQQLDDQRLARLEQAVDAIAIEVERILESQRFTAKLLADRSHTRLILDGAS